MKAYHYTAVSLSEAILSSSIREGHLMHSDGAMTHNVVWLTTDERPYGHGLTLGSEKLNASQIAHQERVIGGPLRNARTLDKTQLRIGLELDASSNPGLISFMNYCKTYESKTFARWMGLSCIVDMNTVPEKELKRLARVAATKESTWWLSFSPVPPETFISVDFNVEGKFAPYDFELHGRRALRRLGFVFPSTRALAEVAELIPRAHRFEMPKAFVFCEDPSKPPKIVFRGGAAIHAFEVQSRSLFMGEPGDKTAALQAWIARHEEELMGCWQEAVGLYYDAYPDRRPSGAARA
jgi:hypothetical protein